MSFTDFMMASNQNIKTFISHVWQKANFMHFILIENKNKIQMFLLMFGAKSNNNVMLRLQNIFSNSKTVIINYL